MTTDIHDPLTSQDQHDPQYGTSNLEIIIQTIITTIIITVIIWHFITWTLDILKPPRSKIDTVISVIKDESEIVRGLLGLLKVEGGCNPMLKQCEALFDVFSKEQTKPLLGQPDQSSESSSDDADTRAAKHKQRLKALKKKFEREIWELLKECLKLTYRITDRKRRSQDLADALIYFITIVHQCNYLREPDQRIICKIVHYLYDPLNKFNFLTESDMSHHQYTWDEVSSVMLGDKDIFAQFCLRLNNYHTLVYFFKEHHQLIFVDEWLNGLIDRLVEYLPYDFMNELLRSVRDKIGQTRLFLATGNEIYTYIKLYMNHAEDLYRLLSIPNTNGQTALHVNTGCITELLAASYTPKQQAMFIKFIANHYETTALRSSNCESLSSLIRRVKHNEYVTDQHHTNILIVYDTNVALRKGCTRCGVKRKGCTRCGVSRADFGS